MCVRACVEQLTDAYDKQSLMLGTEAGGVLWYRPSSLQQLLSLKAQYQNARLVSGATSVGLSTSLIRVCLNLL